MNHVIKTGLKSNIFKIVFTLIIIGIVVWFTQTDLFIDKQRELNNSLMGAIRELRGAISFETMLTITLFSILYGIIHALSPGHGKLVISNFLLNNSNKYRKALFASLVTTMTHVGVAVLIAFLFKYVFTTIRTFQRIAVLDNFQTVSAIIISSIGALILAYPFIKRWIPLKDKVLTENTVLTGMLAGAAPCPLSMTIMLVSISYSIEHVGIVLVGAIALGILIFLSVFSLLFVHFRESSAVLMKRTEFTLPVNFKYIQGLFYIIIGIILF